MGGFIIYVSHTLHQVCACGVFILKKEKFLIILFYFVCCYLRYLPGIGKYYTLSYERINFEYVAWHNNYFYILFYKNIVIQLEINF